MKTNQNPADKTTVYTSGAGSRSVWRHLAEVFREFPQAHELGYRLFKRNIKAQYRQSFLGFAWALIPPFVTAALWIFLRRNGVMTIGDTGIPYPVFVMIGTLLWQMFSESILTPLKMVNDNKSMLSKINIPREGLLLAGFYELMMNAFIKAILILLVLLMFRQTVSPCGIALAPLGMLCILLTGFSIGLVLTPLGMLFTDINRGLTVLLPFLMYLTPVIYPTPREGLLGTFMKVNPLATFIPVTRDWLTAQPVSHYWWFAGYAVFFLFLLSFSLIVYRLAMPMIIERMGT
jgi:lipopolysaccharide transport system permease protein